MVQRHPPAHRRVGRQPRRADHRRLVLSENDGPGRRRELWKANTATAGTNASAKLLNTGNLVVLSSDGATLWQSFENPSDAILAGMPLRMSHRARPPSRVVSWRGPEDPSRGVFSVGADPDSPLQLFLWNGSVPYWRAAVWNGYVASDMLLQGVSPLMYLTISTGADGETYSTFGLSDGSSKVWYKAEHSGEIAFLRWNASSSEWTPISRSPAYKCNAYGHCGAYGYCDNTDAVPTCKCLDGFGPRDEAGWVGGDFSRGCRQKEALRCDGGDGFLTLPSMKAPDRFLRLWNKSLEDCAAECSSNCSCVAYADANLSTSSIDGDATRCLMWTGELIDVEKGGVGNENLYLRLAGLSSKGQKSIIVKVIPAVSVSVLLILVFTGGA